MWIFIHYLEDCTLPIHFSPLDIDSNHSDSHVVASSRFFFSNAARRTTSSPQIYDSLRQSYIRVLLPKVALQVSQCSLYQIETTTLPLTASLDPWDGYISGLLGENINTSFHGPDFGICDKALLRQLNLSSMPTPLAFRECFDASSPSSTDHPRSSNHIPFNTET